MSVGYLIIILIQRLSFLTYSACNYNLAYYVTILNCFVSIFQVRLLIINHLDNDYNFSSQTLHFWHFRCIPKFSSWRLLLPWFSIGSLVYRYNFRMNGHQNWGFGANLYFCLAIIFVFNLVLFVRQYFIAIYNYMH